VTSTAAAVVEQPCSKNDSIMANKNTPVKRKRRESASPPATPGTTAAASNGTAAGRETKVNVAPHSALPRPAALPSPLRAAKTAALLQHINYRHGMSLNADRYAALAAAGLSRNEVNQAADDLVRAGKIRIETQYGMIRLVLVGAAGEGGAA
jgi:hypothetical protein